MNTTHILLTAAKGGVGTGFVTVNIALALCRRGKRVLLIDAGPFCRSHDTILGCEGEVVYDLGDVAHDRIAPEKAFLRPLPDTELSLLPGVFRPEDRPAPDAFATLLPRIAAAGDFDFVLTDAPALPETVAMASCFHQICVVTDTTPAALRAAETAGDALSRTGREVRLLINRFSFRRPQETRQEKAISMVDTAHLALLGLIPPVGEMEERPIPLYPLIQNTRAYKKENARHAFDNIAGRLLSMDIPLLSGVSAVRCYRRRLLY